MATDLEKLQGVWTITSLAMDGQDFPTSGLGNGQIIVDKAKFKSIAMGTTYEGVIEIDEKQKPKTFDLRFTAGPEEGNRNLGIYRLDGNVWTVCLATRGDKRPRRFASEAGSGFALETLTRGVKAAQPPKQKQKSMPEPAAKPGAPTELEGEWDMVAAVFNGAPMDESMVKWCKRITAGDITSVTAGPQVMLKASFTVDTSRRPAAIDYVNLAGAAKGKRQAGIFELSEGLLRICMSAPGGQRPSEFDSRPGDGRSFTTWRRNK